MEQQNFFWKFCTKCAAHRFAKDILANMNQITLDEIIHNHIYRNLFAKFIQYGHKSDSDSMKLLKRFILTEKILKNPNIIDDPTTFETLIELSPSFSWEKRILRLSKPEERNLNFVYMIENLKWESIVEIMCHEDYERFLRAIANKSNLILKLLRKIYRSE